MNASTYLIVVPNNCTSDIHICGRCKTQFTALNYFLEHKILGACVPLPIGSKDDKPERCETNLQGSLSGNGKAASVIRHMNEVKDIVEDEVNCDRRTSLINDEEDVATLLANQLSGQESGGNCSAGEENLIYEESPQPSNFDSTDSLAKGVNVEKKFPPQPVESSNSNQQEKERPSMMYRGKIRCMFRCEVAGCSYKTHLKKDIDRHSRTHTGERPFKCFICDKAFTRADKLLLHQRAHTGDKRYKCTSCSYAAVDSGSLIKHLRIHNGERPFKCQLCSYRSICSSQLTVHLRSHTGDSPFICTNGKCKAAFKTNSDLKRHIGVHSGMKPFSCVYCPYKSTFKGALQLHTRNNHPNGELTEYRCNQCEDSVFPTVRKMKIHMKKCHNNETEQPTVEKKSRRSVPFNDMAGKMVKTYKCSAMHCDASFVCQKSLHIHERFHDKIGGVSNNEKKDGKTFQRIHEVRHEKLIGLAHEKQSPVLVMDPCLDKREINLLATEIALLEHVTMSDNLRPSDMFSTLNSRHTVPSSAIYPDDISAPPVVIT